MEATTAQSVVFGDLFSKPLQPVFDQPDSRCDSRAMLLKACDQNLGRIDVIIV